jgi:hypothetical protein
MKKENDLVAMLLVGCLQDQIAKVRGMQSRLRSYYKLNGRYFRPDYCKKTDLDHVARMVFGMANEMSETAFFEAWNKVGKDVFKFYTVFEENLLQRIG